MAYPGTQHSVFHFRNYRIDLDKSFILFIARHCSLSHVFIWKAFIHNSRNDINNQVRVSPEDNGRTIQALRSLHSDRAVQTVRSVRAVLAVQAYQEDLALPVFHHYLALLEDQAVPVVRDDQVLLVGPGVQPPFCMFPALLVVQGDLLVPAVRAYQGFHALLGLLVCRPLQAILVVPEDHQVLVVLLDPGLQVAPHMGTVVGRVSSDLAQVVQVVLVDRYHRACRPIRLFRRDQDLQEVQEVHGYMCSLKVEQTGR